MTDTSFALRRVFGRKARAKISFPNWSLGTGNEKAKRRPHRLLVEELEDRVVPSFFPSTTNGIHIIEDQLPSSLSSTMTQFVATHMDGTEKELLNQTNQFRAINPNFTVLHYQLGTGNSPYDYIINNQWTSDWNYVNGQESWFAHQTYSGEPQSAADLASGRVGNNTGWDQADIANSAWQQYTLNQVLQNIAATGSNAWFADSYTYGIGGAGYDNPIPTRYQGTNAANPADWPGGITWTTQLGNWAQTIETAFAQYNSAHGTNYKFLPNLDARATSWEPDWYNNANGVPFIDGAFLESFGQYTDTYDWSLSMNRGLNLTRNGKIALMQPYPSSAPNTAAGQQQIDFFLGTYLLLKGDQTYLNIDYGGGVQYYPEYQLNLGTPTTSLPSDVSGYLWNNVYRRDFQNGFVLVNPGTTTYTLSLGGTYQKVIASGGGTMSNSQIDANGNYIGGSLSYQNVSSVTLTGGSAVILLNNPATVSSLVVSGFPSPGTAGVPGSFTVTAEDSSGHVVTGYTGTVHFTNSAGKAVLPADYTFTAADAGVHTFSATLRSAGTQSITARDTANSSITGSQTGIVVNPAATNHLVVSQFPSKTTAGVSQSFKVTAQDMFGNTTPGYTGTIHITSSDGQAGLPADSTLSNGAGSFSATLRTAGSQSITAQDTVNPAIAPGTQAGITVNPAAASRLQVSGFPSSVIAGTAHNFTVTALDPYGNIATGYRGTVSFSSTDSQAMLPGNYGFVSGDAGVHGFSATLNTPGSSQSITATDTVNAGITGTETGIAVVSMQPTAGVSGPPVNAGGSSGVPGQPLAFTLTASESGLPASTVYSYSVNWGDGSSAQTFSGPSGTRATHAFPGVTSYTITVTATDPSGNGSLPASTSISLTALAMETDPANSSLTALYVGGTAGSDTIAITPAVRTVNGNLDYGVKVGMNMVNYGSFFSISRVVVYGQAGADIIKTAAQTVGGVFTYVSVPVMFFSGGDNDILNLTGSGSNAGTAIPNNVLVGGGGTDRLIGGQGRDILIGGAGLSTLQAGSGGDLLIGGTTAYDNNAAALAAILAEWSRTDIDYTGRMDHLTGKVSGGLNGNYLLITKMGNANTVFDNGLADNLQGGAGLDWFVAGVSDTISNKTNGEVVTQI